MKTAGVDSNLISTIKEKVAEQLTLIKNSDDYYVDSVFKEVRFQATEQDILFYPEATINKKNYYGLFKAPDIF